MSVMHGWAAQLIGLPYVAGGQGPYAFDCWGLVRHAFRVRFNLELPHLGPGLDDAKLDQMALVLRAARLSGWRPLLSAGQPCTDDVVIMRGAGALHVGWVVVANGRTGVLHARSDCGVLWQPFREACDGLAVELWRCRA